MKKSLLALAVLAASGAAMAQSSVTLYGVADLSLAKTNAPVAGNAERTAFQVSGSSYMNNGTSRLGVRGVEDLGGGLKASFNFEHGLNMENGAGNLSGGQLFSRAANMSLMGGFGEIRAGRSLTTSFFSVASWELTGTANYSALGKTYRYAGIGSRANSAFAYITPNFGGFTAAAAYVSKHDVGANVWDLGLMYNNGPIAAGLSANKVSGGKTNYQLGGKYSFGNFALAASYNQASDAGGLRRRGASIGGSATFGATSIALDLTRDTKNEWTGKKYTNGVLEAKYALSKRTFVYGAFLRYDGDNNYGVGVRHNF